MQLPDHDLPDPLWVFGYGSLMWNPGFEVAEQTPAVLHDFERGFAMYSVHYRGTKAAPGLVLALYKAKEAQCAGVAFRLANGADSACFATLRERELFASGYEEHRVVLQAEDGRQLQALAYVIDPGNAFYAGHLSYQEQVKIIGTSAGNRGANKDYLYSTVNQLDALGLPDSHLRQLDTDVRKLCGD